MSKVRNEFQKARRVYLAKCKKDGVKPMLVEDFKKVYEKGLAKKVAKPAEKKVEAKKPLAKCAKKCDKKCASKGKDCPKKRPVITHYVHKGDVIVFKDFPALRIAKYAVRLLTLAIEDMEAASK